MEIGLLNVREDGEHDGVRLVEISRISATQHNFFFETAPFDGIYIAMYNKAGSVYRIQGPNIMQAMLYYDPIVPAEMGELRSLNCAVSAFGSLSTKIHKY